MSDQLFYYLAAVPVLGIIAQVVSYWTRLPSILLLMVFGILLGTVANPEVLINEAMQVESGHQAAQILFPLVSLAVGIILFEGGLSLKFGELKGAGIAVLRLVSAGALVSWICTTVLAVNILGMNWRIALLLGAILVVTGPTVIAPLIRQIRPNKKISSVIKWEGIVIDPIGAILAVLVFEHIIHGASSRPILSAMFTVLTTVTCGVLIAALVAVLLILLVKRFLIPDFLHGVVFLAAAIGAFALSNYLLHESGLVTVTVLGIILANQRFIAIEHVIQFKENLGVLLISSLFIVLGSRLDFVQLASSGPRAFLFVGLLILVVRPVSVWLSLVGTDTSNKEKLFLAFLAPRGIVAAAVVSVFSLRIIGLAGHDPAMIQLVDDARQIVPITFLVILVTVAVYGLTAAPLARRLSLADTNPQGVLFAGADDWIRDLAQAIKGLGFNVTVIDTNYSQISDARMLGLSAHCASILSDYVREEIDLAGIGYFVALTRNDEVNELSVNEFAHVFSRKNVFRLPLNDSGRGRRTALGGKTRGRQLFAGTWNEKRIWQAYQAGWRIKVTKLTEEFDFQDFTENYASEFLLIATVENARLNLATSDSPLQPAVGQTIVSLVKANSKVSSQTSESLEFS